MRLPQKDWDNLKRSIEEMIEVRGGSFADTRAKSGVKSTYQYNGNKRSTVWHTSYSDAYCAIHNQKSFITRYLFADIGLSATNVAKESALVDYLNAAEISKDEFDFINSDNDNVVNDVNDVGVDYELASDIDSIEQDLPVVDPSDWLSYAVQRQRINAVVEFFETIGGGHKFDASVLQKYLRASGLELDVKAGADNDETNEDYGLWVLVHQDIFLNTEQYLKSPDVFWGLFGRLWALLGTSDPRWKDAWARDNRMQTHLKERVRACEQISFDGGAYINDFLNRRNMNEDITVYRWFFARDDASIRKSADKNSDDWFVQSEGGGFAYSLSRSKVCALTAAWLNQHHIRKEFDGDESQVKKIQAKWKMKGQHAIWDGSQRIWIGTYRVKKRDIVGTFISARAEEEIVATNAKIIRYEVLTLEEAFTSMMMRNVFRSLGKGDREYVQLQHVYEEEVSCLLKEEISKMFDSLNLSMRDVYEKGAKSIQIDEGISQIFRANLQLRDTGTRMGHLALK
jgi:hypothetical protein